MSDSPQANKSGVNPVAAAVAGAAVGAAVVAGAVVLSDKDNQKKIKDTFNGAKADVKEAVGDAKDAVDHRTNEMKNSLTS